MDFLMKFTFLEIVTISEIRNLFYTHLNYILGKFNWDWQISLWWASLTLFSILNIVFWLKTYQWYKQTSHKWMIEEKSFIKLQLFLSAGYVFVCAFRSIVPRADVQKIVIWDTWLSSIMVGRSLATIGELCLAAQLALLLNYLSKKYNSSSVRLLSFLLFPILFMAEWFSWYSVLTTNYLGNTIEESLWCASGVLMILTSLILISKTTGKEKYLFGTMGFYGFLYVLFMVTIDVPMYYNRYIEDSMDGKTYYTLLQGFIEINTNWNPTTSYIDWQGELSWMFLYFTTAVWVSLGMIRTPFLLKSFHSINFIHPFREQKKYLQ